MRSSRTLQCAAIVLLALTKVAQADPLPSGEKDLGIDEVLRSVERSFPLIAAAAREQDEAAGTLLSSEGGFDPSLRAAGTIEPIGGYAKQYFTAQVDQPTAIWGTSFFAGYRYGSGKIPVYDGKLETNEYGEVRGGVRVPIWRDGSIDRRRASLRQAELGVMLAKLSVAQQRIEARRVAALRYWDWVAAGRRLATLRGWLALAEERDGGLGVRAARGDIPELDRVENQRTVLQRQAAVVGAERDLAQAGLELSLFIRDQDGQSLVPPLSRLPKTFPELASAELPSASAEEDRALARRPDFRRFDIIRDRSRIEADFARNQQKPGIDATMFGARQFGAGEMARGESVLGFSLVLDIPTLNRVQTGREQAAEANVAKTEEQKRFARDRIVADVRASLVTIEASRQRAAMAQKELQVATQLAAGELRRFELGESTLLLVNLREQASAEAAIRQIEAQADFERATANFRAATARDAPP